MAKTTHPLSLARKKYARHKAQAKFREIDFDFTFDDWHDWWLKHGVDKNINTKWPSNYRPCMCRFKDQGAYTLNNVYFANHVDNVIDAHQNNRGNPRGSRTELNYRWGNKLITLKELMSEHQIPENEKIYYKANTYDAKNQHETNRLIKRYAKLSFKSKKVWITPAGQFDNVTLAAESVGLLKDTFRYWVERGRYQMEIVQLLPTLREYILENSRYPDAYIPKELE
jgi:hypothetical protein